MIIICLISMIVVAVICWCVCIVNPREPWEDVEQEKYLDNWVKEKNMRDENM